MNKIFRLLVLFLFVGTGFGQEPVNFGWVKPTEQQRALAENSTSRAQLEELVKYADDSNAFLYRYLYKTLKDSNLLSQEELDSGRLNSLNQGSVGSCVGYSSTNMIEITYACNIALRKEMMQIWKARVNPDAVYAIGRLGNLGGWDGSSAGWSVENLQKYGSLFRLQYDNYDLRNTQPTQGREWARIGVPKPLLEVAANHKALNYVQVKTVEEAKALIQNGYAVVTGAQASYPNTRDKLAFSKRNGTSWSHALNFHSYRNAASGREGFLCQNSWDDWNNGPIYPEDMPIGSFWVTPEDLQFHLNQGDAYSISDYQGFKRRNLKFEEIFKIGEEINVEDN